MTIKKSAGFAAWVGVVTLLSLTACASHSYTAPVVTTVSAAGGGEADVAWIVEDGGRIVRCVNGPDRPICRRANVD